MNQPPAGFTQLVDLLRELARRGASGLLHVALPDGEALLFLGAGQLLRAELSDRPAATALAQLAVRRGVVGAPRLQALLAEQPGAEVGRLLLERNLVDAARLAELRALQLEEVLGSLAVEPLGDAYLEPGGAIRPQPGLEAVSLQALAEDLERRVAEWPVLVRRLGAQDRRVRRRAGAALPADLAPREQELLALLGSPRSVGELAARSPWGEFLTLRTLYLLLERALVELEGEEASAVAATAQVQQRALRHAGRGHQALDVGLALLAASLLLVGAWRLAGGPPDERVPLEPDAARLHQALARDATERVRAALAVHRLLEEHLPQELDGLVTSGCATPAELGGGPGSIPRFQYQRLSEASYLLLPAPR